MTAPRSRYDPGDAAARSREGVEAPVRPVLAGRGGLRQRAGLMAVAVVAIAVVAAGIGLGGPGPEPGPSGSPSASGGATPSELAAIDCRPVDPAALPEIRMTYTTSKEEPIAGVPRPADTATSSPTSRGWPVPAEPDALHVRAFDSLVVVPDADGCVRHVVAEYVAASDPEGPSVPAELSSVRDLNPPLSRAVVGRVEPGDWILRVVASFSTGVAGRDDDALVERFFRVTVDTGVPATPQVTPAAPCRQLAAEAPLPALYLAVGDAAPVLGLDVPFYPDGDNNGPLLTGTVPSRFEVRVAGDVCATSWLLELLDPVTGNAYTQDMPDNPTENPYLVAQNRIPLQAVALGRSVLRATVRFGAGREAHAAWQLALSGPPAPAAEAVGPDNRRVAARAGCGTGWSLNEESSAFEPCSEQTLPTTLDLLTVRLGTIVGLEVPGWRITSWGVGCGSGTPGGSFSTVADCQLGSDGDGSSPAAPVRFLPFPGRTVVVVWVSAERAGIIAFAQYYFEVLATP